MNIQETIGLVSGVIGFLGFAPYLLSMIKGESRPNRATWGAWLCVDVVLWFTYYEQGSLSTMALPTAFVLGAASIFIMSLFRGTGGSNVLDVSVLVLTLVCFVAWLFLDINDEIMYLTISVTLFGSIPTFKKAYKNPNSENKTAWTIFLVGAIGNMIAMEVPWTLDTASLPIMYLIIEVMMFVLIWFNSFLKKN